MKIALDVDDVLADLLTTWIAKLSRLHQPPTDTYRWCPEDLTQWDFAADLGLTDAQLMEALTDDLYNEVLPHAGALSVVNALRARGHEPVYVSTCYQQTVWPWKVEWLARHAFLVAGDQAFPVGKWAQWHTKGAVCKEYGLQLLVDDSVKNCEEWNEAGGDALLLSRPHNRRQLYCGKRLKKFEDLLQEVKGREYARAYQGSVALVPGLPPKLAPELQTLEIKSSPILDLPEPNHTTWPEPEPDKIDLMLDSAMKVYKEEQKRMFGNGDKPTNPKDAVAMNKVPLHFVSGIVKAYQALAHFLGNVKYGSWNYRAGGARASVYVSALGRHVDRWVEGEKYDPIDGTPHLANAQACLNILIEAEETGVLVDDRPPSRIDALNRVYADVERIMPTISERYQDRTPRHYTINDTEVL